MSADERRGADVFENADRRMLGCGWGWGSCGLYAQILGLTSLGNAGQHSSLFRPSHQISHSHSKLSIALTRLVVLLPERKNGVETGDLLTP
jgi:hypothetical protein